MFMAFQANSSLQNFQLDNLVAQNNELLVGLDRLQADQSDQADNADQADRPSKSINIFAMGIFGTGNFCKKKRVNLIATYNNKNAFALKSN